ncbi:MAG TPA: hypothetical protein VGL68_01485 [Solirubrobacteraceae bacterium]|jgi:uncharacterized small protein (DUF1192 family)
MEASTREKVVGRLLRMGVSDSARSPSGETLAVDELEAEVTLLREENARLKIERHRPTDAGHVIERMRSIRPEVATARRDGEAAAPPAQVIAECLAVRDGLMEACQEVQRAMQGIRGRLGALAGDMQGRSGDRAMNARLAASTVETLDIDLTVAADVSPALAQSAA